MASLLSAIVTSVIADLNDPAMTTANVLVGRRHTRENAGVPRIVFVPIGGPVVPPDRVGGRVIATGVKARQIATRRLQVLVEIHGSDVEQTEILLTNTIRAIRKSIHNSVEFGEENWTSQEETEDGLDQFGETVQLTFTVQSPVFDVSRPLTGLTGSPKIIEGSELWGNQENPCKT